MHLLLEKFEIDLYNKSLILIPTAIGCVQEEEKSSPPKTKFKLVIAHSLAHSSHSPGRRALEMHNPPGED